VKSTVDILINPLGHYFDKVSRSEGNERTFSLRLNPPPV